MPPVLSPKRKNFPVLPGLDLLSRGKVRDMYEIDDERALIVASDGISIFDFVLNACVPKKGMVLNAMSHYWLRHLETDLRIKTHLITAGQNIDTYLPADLRGNPDLQARSMVVHRLNMSDGEFIARGFLTGSGLKSYNKTGEVCGHKLPPGLQDGDELPVIIDTPTTKAQEGHDEELDARAVAAKFPEETALLLKVYSFVLKAARESGIIFADTKLEFGRNRLGTLLLGDEVATPDSSRYWDASAWSAGRTLEKRKAPPPYDKQIVRQWGIEQGVRELNPLVPEHIAMVHDLQVPDELIQATIQIYYNIFQRITGVRLEMYLWKMFGIQLPAAA
jgi:phosphoribosylaminoimidazole-succinocarboxamide synthase